MGLWIAARSSPYFRGVRWLAGAYLAGAAASALRHLHLQPDGGWLIYASNTFALLMYVLLHFSLLQVLERGGTRPWVGGIALLIQTGVGPFLRPANDDRTRDLLAGVLLTATLIQICYVVLRQGLPKQGRPASTGMKACTSSMVVILMLNAACSLGCGLLVGRISVPGSEGALLWLHPANMVSSIVCAVGILLCFLWMTAECLQRDLEIQARQDGLTGLLNRGALEAEFEREVQRAERNREPVALLLLDLDHFKFINDLYGHHSGDLVLCEVALALQATLRRVDLVARTGGEEFVAVLPRTTLLEAEAVAERVRREIQSRAVACGVSRISVTASFGLAVWDGPGDEWESLLRRADAGMYRAKGSGRNRVEVFTS